MKKIFLLLPLALLLMSLQCENRTLEQVTTIEFNETYNVNKLAPFNESTTLTRSDVLDMFDIPAEATIKAVHIESIAARVVVQEGNQASALSLSGRLALGSSNPELFSNFPVVLVQVDAPFIGLNSLISDGVNGLKNKIESYLIGSDTAPFDIRVSGNSTPTGGQLIKAQILLKIQGTITWEICEEMPVFLIEAGEKCEVNQ